MEARPARSTERVDLAPLAVLDVDPASALVYVLGWQTCSPSTTYPVTDRPHRPVDLRNHFIGFRPGRPIPPGVFQGEGLLAVQPEAGSPVHVFGVPEVGHAVPTIRARLEGRRLIVSSDGQVEHRREEPDAAAIAAPSPAGASAIDVALARWADRFSARMGVREQRLAPAIWCSWYRYFDQVTERDIEDDVVAMGRLDLPVDVVQVDDGWQRTVGDWDLAPRFGSLRAVVERAAADGRAAGIWVAPFLVRASSDLARRRPQWLVHGDDGSPLWIGRNWDDDLYALDSTRPEAWGSILDRLRALRELGFTFFKLDFLYAGAVEGRRQEDVGPVLAYRAAMTSIREAIGHDAYVLGAGPLLPSVGFVDAMRIAPDIAVEAEPPAGDVSQPAVSSAMLTSRGRAFSHGRLFANDADCLIARPGFEQRSRWLEHLRAWGGLRGSSDRLVELDAWGIEATREWLASPPPARLIPS